jgi:hypothetical protein
MASKPSLTPPAQLKNEFNGINAINNMHKIMYSTRTSYPNIFISIVMPIQIN